MANVIPESRWEAVGGARAACSTTTAAGWRFLAVRVMSFRCLAGGGGACRDEMDDGEANKVAQITYRCMCFTGRGIIESRNGAGRGASHDWACECNGMREAACSGA